MAKRELSVEEEVRGLFRAKTSGLEFRNFNDSSINHIALRGVKAMNAVEERLTVIERYQRTILDLLNTLVLQRTVKDWYSVEEVAKTVDRSEWQVREWLRTGRVHGIKRPVGRGRHKEWSVSHEELERFRNHGLRPVGETLNPGAN